MTDMPEEMSRKERLTALKLLALGGSRDGVEEQIGEGTPLGDPNWPQTISIDFDGFDEIHIDYEGETYEVVEIDGRLTVDSSATTQETDR